jgi:VanZ family protein
LIGVVALIAYGSLYPFNFKPDAIEGGVLRALVELSWARAGRGDRIANVLLYLPLGFCLFLWLNARLRRHMSVLVATALGALLSLGIEVAQVYVSVRVPSLADLTLNSLGSALGAAGGLLWLLVTKLLHLPSREDQPARDPGAALVIAAWAAFRLAPFVPQFDLGKLKAALRPLFEPQFDPPAVFIYLTCWLIVDQALASLVRRSRRLEALLLLIAGVLAGRLVLANQTFVADELLALVLLVPMLVLMHRFTARVSHGVLMTALAAVLLIEGLAPFDFVATATRFDFWPFMVWFESGPIGALQAVDWRGVFGHLFLFMSLLWLMGESGVRINAAIAITTSAALGIEILQMWLPNQSGSIADPLLTLAAGLLFRYLGRRAGRDARYGNTISPPARSR